MQPTSPGEAPMPSNFARICRIWLVAWRERAVSLRTAIAAVICFLESITKSTIEGWKKAGSSTTMWRQDLSAELAASFKLTTAVTKEQRNWSHSETWTSFPFESRSECSKLGYLGLGQASRASYLILSWRWGSWSSIDCTCPPDWPVAPTIRVVCLFFTYPVKFAKRDATNSSYSPFECLRTANPHLTTEIAFSWANSGSGFVGQCFDW